ncbi:MAG: glycosyltransferase, partial [Anaerolineae bacterium]
MSKITAVLAPGKRLAALMNQSLFTNAGYLLGVNMLNAAAGFVFWSLASRLYTPGEVGTASAVISAIGIVSGIAGLGVSIGLVRVLPESQTPTRLLNTALTFNTGTAVLSSIVFLVGLPLWSPSLIPLQETVLYAFGFVIYTVIMTLGIILQAVPIARRQSLYAFIHTCVASIGRLVLLIPLMSLGVLGMVSSTLLALLVTIVIDLAIILPKVENGYRLRAEFSWQDLSSIIPYSAGSYIELLLTQTPQMVLPLIALETFGTASSGYTYIAWMLGTLLISPGMAVATSAFAEGSNSPHSLESALSQATRLSLILTLPAAAIVGFAATWILLLFGPSYAQGASGLLRWLAATAPVVVLVRIYFTRIRVQKRIGWSIVLNSIVATTTVVAAVILMPSFGLSGIGIGWLTGNCLVAATAIIDIRKEHQKEKGKPMPTTNKTRPKDQAPQTMAAIPCYNEENFVADIVRQVAQYVDQVIVVDDGSTDRTTEVAEAAGATVIRHKT